jgi:hypothetical protein
MRVSKENGRSREGTCPSPNKSNAGLPAIERGTPKCEPGDRVSYAWHGRHKNYDSNTSKFPEYSTFLYTSNDMKYLTMPVILTIIFSCFQRSKDFFLSSL